MVMLAHPGQVFIDLTEDLGQDNAQELTLSNKGFISDLPARTVSSAIPSKRTAESSGISFDDASTQSSRSKGSQRTSFQLNTPRLTPQPDGVSVVIPSPSAHLRQQIPESESLAFTGLSQKHYPLDYFEKAAAQRVYPVARPVDRAAIPLSILPSQIILSHPPSVENSIRDMIDCKLKHIRGPSISIAPTSTRLLARLANFDFINDPKIQDGVEITPPEFIGGCGCKPACFPSTCLCPFVEENSDAPIEPYELYAPASSLFVLKEEFLERNSMIKECNHNCACASNSSGCWNTVVQRGRTVHLEIFDTGPRGFGLRSLDYIRRGQYIDRYLGEIITRKDADIREASTQGGQSYLFSLDWWHDDDKIYVIDGQKFGSATRFMNHSCDPNCKMVPVSNIHGDNQRLYDLAFFARRDIPPGTELTFDYNPGWKPSHKKVDPDAVKCLCGSKKCRGQLWPNRRKA